MRVMLEKVEKRVFFGKLVSIELSFGIMAT